MMHRCTALATALAFAAITGLAHAQSWKMYSYHPNANLPAGQGLVRITERVANETNGSIKIDNHWGGSLPIKVTDITQAVGDGAITIAADGFFAGHAPIASMLRLPLLVESIGEHQRAWPSFRPHVERALEKLNVKLLGLYLYEPVTIFTNRPVVKLADLNGMKIRQGDPISTDLLKSYGVSGITLGTADVPSALQQGLVQGVVTASSGGGRIWGDLLTHNLRLPMYVPEGLLIVNKRTFDALPEASRKVIERIVAEEGLAITGGNVKGEADVMNQHRTKGMVITTVAGGEIADARKRMEPVWQQWAKKQGSQGEAALGEIRKTLGR